MTKIWLFNAKLLKLHQASSDHILHQTHVNMPAVSMMSAIRHSNPTKNRSQRSKLEGKIGIKIKKIVLANVPNLPDIDPQFDLGAD